jgi:hypothetical protein
MNSRSVHCLQVDALPTTYLGCAKLLRNMSSQSNGTVTLAQVKAYLEDRAARLVKLPQAAFVADSVLSRGQGPALGLPPTAYRSPRHSNAAEDSVCRAVFSPSNGDCACALVSLRSRPVLCLSHSRMSSVLLDARRLDCWCANGDRRHRRTCARG